MPGDAFVTLLTNDGFSPGAEALLFSLRKTTTKATLVVLVTPEVSARVRRVLGRAADSVVDVLPISNPHATHVAGWADAGFTKLRIWQQTQFDRIVYVDADAVVVDNIDELFALDVAFAAAPDVFPPDKFNAGVLVIKPCLETFARLEARPSADKAGPPKRPSNQRARAPEGPRCDAPQIGRYPAAAVARRRRHGLPQLVLPRLVCLARELSPRLWLQRAEDFALVHALLKPGLLGQHLAAQGGPLLLEPKAVGRARQKRSS